MTPSMRKPARFRQGDVTRALRAAKASGNSVARVEIDPDGKLCIVMVTGERSEAGAASPFDAWKGGRDARQT